MDNMCSAKKRPFPKESKTFLVLWICHFYLFIVPLSPAGWNAEEENHYAAMDTLYLHFQKFF